MEDIEKKHWWDSYTPQCPECKSKDIEELNLYKGYFKKNINRSKAIQLGIDPDELKRKQKHKCNVCGNEFWLDEGIF